MGWRLAEAVLADCPDIPYREFRVLIAFAMSARDTTCCGMPGTSELARLGRCSERTARRAMSSLISRGLVEVAERSAPGRRAVYRLLPMPGSPAERGTAVLATERGTAVLATDTEANVGQIRDQRWPDSRPTPANTDGPPLVKHPSYHPSITGGSVIPPTGGKQLANGYVNTSSDENDERSRQLAELDALIARSVIGREQCPRCGQSAGRYKTGRVRPHRQPDGGKCPMSDKLDPAAVLP